MQAYTPSRDRRKSGWQARETPRSVLRALSKKLAPATQRPQSSSPQTPQSTARQRTTQLLAEIEDGEDEADLPAPRPSLPLLDEETNDDLMDERPPMRSELPLDDFDEDTRPSVEGRRRERFEAFSRGSPNFTTDGVSEMLDPIVDIPGEVDEVNEVGSEDMTAADDVLDQRVGLGDDVQLESARQSRRRSSFNFEFPNGTFEKQGEDEDSEDTFRFEVPGTSITQSEPPKQTTHNTVQILEEEIASDDDVEDDQSISATSAAEDLTIGNHEEVKSIEARKVAVKPLRTSRYGIEYPSMPSAVVKRLITKFARTTASRRARVDSDTLAACVQASDWFFEQMSEDLGKYAEHAGRKRIEEADVVMLMKR